MTSCWRVAGAYYELYMKQFRQEEQTTTSARENGLGKGSQPLALPASA